MRAENVDTVSGSNVRAQVEKLRSCFPEFYECIDSGKLESWVSELESGDREKDDFGLEETGGRGPSYIRAQTLNVEARARGINELFRLIRNHATRRSIVVDLLGGDGLVRRVCALLGIVDVDIITCDASPHMVEAAWSDGIPAILQRAERPLFRPESVDAVLLAYGTHHIAPEARAGMVKNCHGILRSGGTFVLHDFLAGSPVDVWFEQIVHPNSLTGHRYVHFTSDEISGYLVKAGFDSCEVMEIDDPYVAIGDSPEEAELNLGEYLVNMYGLCKAQESLGDQGAFRWAVERGRQIFQYPGDGGAVVQGVVEYVDELRAWRFTLPRRAVVGVGRKL